MLNQKTRDNNKLLDLQVLLSNLDDKERHMKQTSKINFAQSQSTGLGGTSLKSGSSLRK